MKTVTLLLLIFVITSSGAYASDSDAPLSDELTAVFHTSPALNEIIQKIDFGNQTWTKSITHSEQVNPLDKKEGYRVTISLDGNWKAEPKKRITVEFTLVQVLLDPQGNPSSASRSHSAKRILEKVTFSPDIVEQGAGANG